MRARGSLAFIVAAAVIAAVISGCSAAADMPRQAISPREAKPTATTEPSILVSEGALEYLPSETLTDWVSYGDRVVVARVLDTAKGELSAEEAKAGEGLAPRSVALEVTETLWSSKRGPDLGGTITVHTGGYVVKAGEEERTLVIAGTPLLTVGSTYLVPLFYEESFEKPWQALLSGIAPFDDGVVGKGEEILGADGEALNSSELSPARESLWGLEIEGVVRALNATEPDPLARELEELPPVERYQAVSGKKWEQENG